MTDYQLPVGCLEERKGLVKIMNVPSGAGRTGESGAECHLYFTYWNAGRKLQTSGLMSFAD